MDKKSNNVRNQIVFNNVYEIKSAPVKALGTGAHVVVPKEWLGCEVQVVLLKDND